MTKYGPTLPGDWTDEHLFKLTRDSMWWITHDYEGHEIGQWPDTRRHGLLLYSLALSVNWPDPNQPSPTHPPRVLEIGVRHGITTMFLLHAMRETGGKLTSVEIDYPFAIVAQERVHEAKLAPWWELHVADCNFYESGEIDMVWIDGDHSYQQCKKDVERFGSKVRKGGYVVMHDAVNELEPGVAAVVEEMRQSGKYDMVVLSHSYGICVARVL